MRIFKINMKNLTIHLILIILLILFLFVCFYAFFTNQVKWFIFLIIPIFLLALYIFIRSLLTNIIQWLIIDSHGICSKNIIKKIKSYVWDDIKKIKIVIFENTKVERKFLGTYSFDKYTRWTDPKKINKKYIVFVGTETDEFSNKKTSYEIPFSNEDCIKIRYKKKIEKIVLKYTTLDIEEEIL